MSTEESVTMKSNQLSEVTVKLMSLLQKLKGIHDFSQLIFILELYIANVMYYFKRRAYNYINNKT